MRGYKLLSIFAIWAALIVGISIGKNDVKTDYIEIETVKTVTEYIKPSEEWLYIGEYEITAYCGCVECSGCWGTSTSTGAVATQKHTAAADPEIIPYGSTVIINGQEYVIEDTGSALKDKKVIDIYFNTHEETEKFGRQKAYVFIKKG